MYGHHNRHFLHGIRPHLHPMHAMNFGAVPPMDRQFDIGSHSSDSVRPQERFEGPPTDSAGTSSSQYMFGRPFKRPRFVWNSSSSSHSSSDSDNKYKKKSKKMKKKSNKKRAKHMKKHWKRMRQFMSDPNLNKVLCTFCWHPIRPFAETEILECGHIYHRRCLKELFAVSQSGDQLEIFCTQCRQQIDVESVTTFQNRFNANESTPGPQSPQNQDMDN